MMKSAGIAFLSILLAASSVSAQTAPGGTGVTGGGSRTEKESQQSNDPSRTGISGTEGNPRSARTPGAGTSGDNPGTGTGGSSSGVATNPRGAATPGTGSSGDNPSSTPRGTR